MYNKTILEGIVANIEYVTHDDNSIVVNGTISCNSDKSKGKCVLYFNIYGDVAIKYHKQLFQNTKVLLEGQLEFKQWNESNGNTKARYSLNVEKLKLLDGIDNKKFSILYSSEDNSFII